MGQDLLIPVDPAACCPIRRPDDPRLGERATRLARVDETPKGAIVLVGVPDDRGVVAGYGRAGAAAGPRVFREHFYRLPLGAGGELSRLILCDAGDLMIVGTSNATHAKLAEVVATIVRRGGIPCVIGGGHDATYGSVTGFARKGKGIGVINIDAHLDLRPPEANGAIGSGTAYRRLIEENIVQGPQLAEYGIQRHAVAEAHWAYARRHKVRLWAWDEIVGAGYDAVFGGLLRDMARARVVVSLDLDAVRAADAPGVSAINPTGLTAREVVRLMQLAGAAPVVQQLEIMELNPTHDVDGRTARLAATCLWHFCAARAAQGTAA